MRKFIIQLFLFSLFSTAVYTGCVIIWGSFVPKRLKKNILILAANRSDFVLKRLADVRNHSTIDILFLGSSHAFMQFDTRIFRSYGYTSFNMGTSSQTPIQSKLFLEKYVDSLHPKIVVVEVFPFLFQSDNVENQLNLIANGLINVSLVETMQYALEGDIKMFNTSLFETFIKREKDTISDATIKKRCFSGYVEVDRKVFIPAGNQKKKGKWNPRKEQLAALDAIIKFTKQKNIELILVQAPVHPVYFNFMTDNDKIDSYFHSKGRYYNFNGILHFTDTTYFFDYHHLKIAGVKIFNESFIKTCLGGAKK